MTSTDSKHEEAFTMIIIIITINSALWFIVLSLSLVPSPFHSVATFVLSSEACVLFHQMESSLLSRALMKIQPVL